MSQHEDNAENAEAFLRKHVQMLRRFLAAQGIAADLADETITDTFLVVERKWKQVETLDDPAAWTRVVAVRIARGKQQQRRSLEARHSTLKEAVSKGEDTTLHVADRELLLRVLPGLPEKQRLAILLRFYAQFTIAETAKLLNVSQGTIMKNTFDGLRNLRRLLEEGNVTGEEEAR